MKLSRAEAIREAKRRLLPHRAVKTRYWSVEEWRYVECWTVVLGAK